jgi:hypothetical protein
MRSEVKKWIALALCAALFAASPLIANARGLDESLFDSAKEALTLLSYGEYQKALDKLNFTSAPTASEFEDFICFELDSVLTQAVQTDVAVAFQKSGKYWVALPVEEPVSRDVQVLLISSADGVRFDGYRAGAWGDALRAAGEDSSAVWNEPYDPGTLVVVPDQ